MVDKDTLPEDYIITTQNVGDDDAVDSDINETTGQSDTVTITDSNITDLDGGAYKTSSLGDYVWIDSNKNGLQDTDEEGVSGIKVYLLDGDGNRLKDESGSDIETVTDSNGKYIFEGLKPNKYAVEFDLNTIGDGFVVTTQSAGDDDTIDSDANPTDGKTRAVELGAGESFMHLDMGIWEPETLIDIEKSTNGADADREYGDDVPKLKIGSEVEWSYTITNMSEEKLLNIKLIDDKEGEISCPQDSLDVNESMVCSKTGIAQEGLYENIAEVTATGELSGEDVNDSDPSHYEGLNGISLGQYVWEDMNGDGLKDEGEPAIAGVKVTLFIKDSDGNWVEATDIEGNKVEPVVTNENGEYLFTNLIPNEDYKIQFEKPISEDGKEYLVTLKDVNTDDARDNEIDDNLEVVVESPEKDDLTIHAGFYKVASIGDYIWEDVNANGVQEPATDIPLENITVILLNSNGEEVNRTTTDSTGKYLFDNLLPAEYQVKVIIPNGYYVTRENVGDDSTDSDLDKFLVTGEALMPKELLESGEDNITFDGGMFKSVCLGDYVWLDVNGNGIQDEGEPPIEGISVKLIPVEDAYGNVNDIDVYGELQRIKLFKQMQLDTMSSVDLCQGHIKLPLEVMRSTTQLLKIVQMMRKTAMLRRIRVLKMVGLRVNQ